MQIIFFYIDLKIKYNNIHFVVNCRLLKYTIKVKLFMNKKSEVEKQNVCFDIYKQFVMYIIYMTQRKTDKGRKIY